MPSQSTVRRVTVRRVWDHEGNLLSTFVSPYTREESQRRADDLLGRPFEQLPGKPPQHRVVGETSDGTKIRVEHVETVYNDWLLFTHIDGEGTYEESYRNHKDRILAARQMEVLELAKKLYGHGRAN